jgi:hypothetical protein
MQETILKNGRQYRSHPVLVGTNKKKFWILAAVFSTHFIYYVSSACNCVVVQVLFSLVLVNPFSPLLSGSADSLATAAAGGASGRSILMVSHLAVLIDLRSKFSYPALLREDMISKHQSFLGMEGGKYQYSVRSKGLAVGMSGGVSCEVQILNGCFEISVSSLKVSGIFSKSRKLIPSDL